MLNKIWLALLLLALASAAAQALLLGNPGAFAEVTGAAFDMARTAFEISLGLTGVMALWLGFMKLGEAGGLVDLLARAFAPLLRRLFPSVPKGHPAEGAIVMNMAANALGLDNAATPLGLKAMRELQSLNPSDDTASDDQILFLVINTSSVTLLPVTVFAYRAQMGAADPTDVFLPILIATFCSTLAGLLVTAAVQRRNLFQPVVLGYLGAMTALVAGLTVWFAGMAQGQVETTSSLIANVLLVLVMTGFALAAARRGAPVYETFVEGAKDGFKVAVGIIPYLVAMLVAIGMFRASGALELVLDGVRGLAGDHGWVDALPTAFMKPLSGSGARGMLIETMQVHGADSLAGRIASIMQGSTETTFYVLAVYFGSVGIRRTRYAAPCGLAADLAGIVAAILIGTLFFA